MQLDVVDLLEFYRTPLGRLASPLLARKIGELWPSTEQDRVLGLGFPTPYLRPFVDRSERTLAFMPAGQGVFAWPKESTRLTALVDEYALPLPDSSVDRMILVHALEMVDNPLAALREAWRVLTPGGRVLIVVPSRRGVWARTDVSPFGYGRPFSRGQLTKLVKDAQFSPERWDGALYLMPSNARLILKSARSWERLGARFWPAFPGVLILEASKHLFQGVPVGEKIRSRATIKPVLVPAATATGHENRSVRQ